VIESLKPGEVFVFGSNAEGQHWGGAARTAHEKFGAEWGVGEGLTGQSYALPTMSGFEDLALAAARFIEFARSRRDLTFLLTAVGCGIAGHKPEDVAPLFLYAPENVILPKEFTAVWQ
jgi:hypothetical protein